VIVQTTTSETVKISSKKLSEESNKKNAGHKENDEEVI